ncbi:hypothetical protein FK530_23135 [Tsukamurella conjunctivitidis]|uniref:ATP-binding protein n=1 Tax=Tsukamurella conjunctivitidis TaxID=2592068 RepID=A0A5C5RTI9_9ACTN|nr:hypothetical protein [Tsukamurella conjunctivitidis]RDB48853.1 hypothetical protein DVB87_06030 [Tsukamurella tyrosinosolvens]TWS25521.1 hypothetical protein FK530_23135 [Tsukamurella conjunctivitidis]
MTTVLPGRHAQSATDDHGVGLRLDAGELSVEAMRRKNAVKQAQASMLKPTMTERERDDLEDLARTGSGPKRLHARILINRDNVRRQRQRDAQERGVSFDVPLLESSRQGFIGRGGGRMATIERMPEWRATTAQLPGLFPWAIGSNSPIVGTPVGTHQESGQIVAFDPLSWYAAGLISAPAAFILALNGFGKSTLARRIVVGDCAHGDVPLLLGDIKPDYRAVVEALDGQVIDFGFGASKINPLGVGALGQILNRGLPAEVEAAVRLEIESRQVLVTASLLEMVRGGRLEDFEETMIAAGLRQLYRSGNFTGNKAPLLADLLNVFRDGPQDLVEASGAYDGTAEDHFGGRATDQYFDATLRLRQTLTAVIAGPFGSIFNAPTSEQLDITSGRPICIDISRIPEGNGKLRAAALMTCWAEGFASIKGANILADQGVIPQMNYHAVMDELARVLSAGGGVVDRTDEITRTQRTDGVATTMITHTIKDLEAFDSHAERQKALGFIERARVKIYGPIPPDEVERNRAVTHFSKKEAANLSAWAASGNPIDDPLSQNDPVRRVASGTGKFLLKAGESDTQPGIPFKLDVVPTETNSHMHATSKRFEHRMAAAAQ